MNAKELHDMLSIREQLIPKLMPDNKAGHVVVATRGLYLGVLTSAKSFKVSTVGTSFLHAYLVALEDALAKEWGVQSESETVIDKVTYEKIDCSRCMATGKINAGGVRTIKLRICPVCHGSKHILKEVEQNS